MEQIGINPSSAISDMYEYLKKEEKSEVIDISELYAFLDYMAEKYSRVCSINMKLHGFTEEPIKDAIYLIENNKKDE